MTTLRILYHARCFDGAVSAALVWRLLRALRVAGEGPVELRGLAHGSGSPYDDRTFAADVCAVVDFRYANDPRLTWWFDHHVSTFLSAADAEQFQQRRSRQHWWDPQAPSCAGFLARVAAEELHVPLLAPGSDWLIWADVIDAARFPDAASAVRLEHPALQLMTWLEAAADDATEAALVREIAEGAGLAELVARPYVAPGLAAALERHHRAIELIRERLHVADGVALVDLADTGASGVNKFIVYDLDPTVTYTVTVLRTPGKTKVSVGSNPWAQERRQHDIAALCGRYGGGGHPAVGAVSLPAGDVERARIVAQEIVAVLRKSTG
jgi:hypothetical protein